MAFVYRTEKQAHKNQRATTPGPGSYAENNSMKSNNPAVGFQDRCARNIWKKTTTPGPGEYKIEGDYPAQQTAMPFSGVNLFYSNPGACSSNFKSKSKRLKMVQPDTPGPGQYQITQDAFKNTSKRNIVSAKPTKLSRYLYSENQKEMGYSFQTPEPDNRFIRNQIFLQKEFLKEEDKKQSVCFASRVERQLPSRPQTSNGVGPGSYNAAQSWNFIDSKPFHNTKCTENVSLKQTASQGQFRKTEERQSLGPGYYAVEKSTFIKNSPSQSKGMPCFGSKESRFGMRIASDRRAKTPGPQTYSTNISNNHSRNSDFLKKKVPFNCGSVKQFRHTTSSGGCMKNVSPGSYNPKDNFDELLKKNYMKGSIGNFGSNVERFKQKSVQKDQIPETNNSNLLIGNQSKIEESKANMALKRKYARERSKRMLEKRILIKFPEQDVRPLCYDTDHLTINKKHNKKQQKNAPFLTASGRFNTEYPDMELQLLEAIRNIEQNKILVKGESNQQQGHSKIQQKSRNVMRTSSAMSKFLKSGSRRGATAKSGRVIGFNKENFDVGPSSYDPAKPQGKSYNVLFKKPN